MIIPFLWTEVDGFQVSGRAAVGCAEGKAGRVGEDAVEDEAKREGEGKVLDQSSLQRSRSGHHLGVFL